MLLLPSCVRFTAQLVQRSQETRRGVAGQSTQQIVIACAPGARGYAGGQAAGDDVHGVNSLPACPVTQFGKVQDGDTNAGCCGSEGL